MALAALAGLGIWLLVSYFKQDQYVLKQKILPTSPYLTADNDSRDVASTVYHPLFEDSPVRCKHVRCGQ